APGLAACRGRHSRRRAAVRASYRPPAKARSQVELAEIFGPKMLEIFLQLLGAQLRRVARHAGQVERLRVFAVVGVLFDEHEQRFAGKDRGVRSERDRDRVGRPRVDADDPPIALEMQLAKVGVALHSSDLHSTHRGAEPEDERLAEIVRQRPRSLDVVHLHHDRLGLRLSDPDRQQPLASLLLQYYHVRLRSRIDAETRHYDFNHRMTRLYRTARRNAAARSVRSHVNVVADDLPLPIFFGVRPKWP